MDKNNKKPTILRQIVQHSINREPSQMAPLVNQEIASRVMDKINIKRTEIGKNLFGN